MALLARPSSTQSVSGLVISSSGKERSTTSVRRHGDLRQSCRIAAHLLVNSAICRPARCLAQISGTPVTFSPWTLVDRTEAPPAACSASCARSYDAKQEVVPPALLPSCLALFFPAQRPPVTRCLPCPGYCGGHIPVLASHPAACRRMNQAGSHWQKQGCLETR